MESGGGHAISRRPDDRVHPGREIPLHPRAAHHRSVIDEARLRDEQEALRADNERLAAKLARPSPGRRARVAGHWLLLALGALFALLTGREEGRFRIAGDVLVVQLGPLIGPVEQVLERSGVDTSALPRSEDEPVLPIADASASRPPAAPST